MNLAILCVLNMVLIFGLIFYLNKKISTLNQNIDAQDIRIILLEDKLNKKDPYEDYRNPKGLLSSKRVKGGGFNG